MFIQDQFGINQSLQSSPIAQTSLLVWTFFLWFLTANRLQQYRLSPAAHRPVRQQRQRSLAQNRLSSTRYTMADVNNVVWFRGTLRSLLNELASLTVLNTVKPASLFNRDLRVPPSQERCAMYESKVLFSSSYVVNFMIFMPFLLQHTQKSIKYRIFLMKFSLLSYNKFTKKLSANYQGQFF